MFACLLLGDFHQFLDNFFIISHRFGFLEIKGCPFFFVLCQLDFASQHIEIGCRFASTKTFSISAIARAFFPIMKYKSARPS